MGNPGRVILSWHRRFLPGDSGTLVALDLDIPVGTDALAVRFRYSPLGSRDRQRNLPAVQACAKEYLRGSAFDVPGEVQRVFKAKDLDRNVRFVRNLFNVVLIEPGGNSVGRWDLGTHEDPPTAWLGADFASPGFVPSPLAPGRWTAAVEVWEVFTDEAEAFLEIEAFAIPPEEVGSARLEGRGSAAPRPRRIARVSIPGVLFGEMHSHSVHSDGQFTVNQQGRRAEVMGLDFVALTDHNVTSGHSEFRDGPVSRLRGEELTTFHGHFCLYGVDRCHPWHDRGRRVRTVDAIDAARASGAMASLAHPNNFGAPVCVGCRFCEGSVPLDRFDLIEVWYGAWAQRRTEIVKTLDLWDRMWDAGLHPVAIAARDWHGFQQEDTPELAFPLTAVQTDDRSEVGILAAIRAGRVFLSCGSAVKLAVRTDSAEGGIGDVVAMTPNTTATISVEFVRPRATPAMARLVRNGRPEAQWELPRRLQARREWTVHSPGRYRVELWSCEGELLALTNHVVLQVKP